MKAIIFAAGLGTRLKPITNNCPKALVELNGKPLLYYAIRKLISAGVNEIVVNIHHFGQQIIEYINQNSFEVPVHISDETDQLLDTGGGLLKAQHLLKGNEPIIAYNVDIITSVNLNEVINWHINKNALVTLVVRKRDTNRYLMFNPNMKLTGWQNTSNGEYKISDIDFDISSPYAFSGIQVISPAIFDLITEKGKFSVTDLYLRLAQKHTIFGFNDSSDFWIDLGKPGQLAVADKYIQKLD